MPGKVETPVLVPRHGIHRIRYLPQSRYSLLLHRFQILLHLPALLLGVVRDPRPAECYHNTINKRGQL